MRLLSLLLAVGLLWPTVLLAQGKPGDAPASAPEAETRWIQIASHSDLAAARQRAREFPGLLPITIFESSNGWLALALGPFARDEAAGLFDVADFARRLPSDAYSVGGDGYLRQIEQIRQGDIQFVQLASRPTEAEARAEAQRLAAIGGMSVTLYEAGNGWIALVIDPGPGGDAQGLLAHLTRIPGMPTDALVTPGGGFVRFMDLIVPHGGAGQGQGVFGFGAQPAATPTPAPARLSEADAQCDSLHQTMAEFLHGTYLERAVPEVTNAMIADSNIGLISAATQVSEQAWRAGDPELAAGALAVPIAMAGPEGAPQLAWQRLGEHLGNPHAMMVRGLLNATDFSAPDHVRADQLLQEAAGRSFSYAASASLFAARIDACPRG